MIKKTENIFKHLPSEDLLLKNPVIAQLEHKYPRNLIKTSIQHSLAYIRNEVLAERRLELPTVQEIEGIIRARLDRDVQFSLKRVINATGTVLHTNLGRAVLSEEIKEHIFDTVCHYSNLEYDLDAGKRGSRYKHVVSILKELTGAEDVLIVNNNAGAVLLTLDTLIKGKEVLISRGELVEIGGFFRIPEVIELSGGTIHEVGTTNKTHLVDYENGLNDATGAVMKVHTSNYRIVGFTESVDMDDLARLAHKNGLPFINDLGSGLFIDMQRFGLPYEPTVKEALKHGCDIVTFSGDKLLGGPQAGIIVGSKKYISKMKQNQLLRALRIDKMSMAVLEATFRLYLDEQQAIERIPTLRMISLSAEECKAKAEQLACMLKQDCPHMQVEVVPDTSAIGGGSYPEHELPGYVVSLQCPAYMANDLEERLRHSETPIISRIKKDQVYLDVRTIDDGEFSSIAQAVQVIDENGKYE